MAAIKYRGISAVTNFDLSRYMNCNMDDSQNPMVQSHHGELETPIMAEATASPPLPIGGATAPPSALGLLLQSSIPPRSSFPDDIQTSFDFQDSSCFADDIIFGGYDSFVPSIFQCGLDVWRNSNPLFRNCVSYSFFPFIIVSLIVINVDYLVKKLNGRREKDKV